MSSQQKAKRNSLSDLFLSINNFEIASFSESTQDIYLLKLIKNVIVYLPSSIDTKLNLLYNKLNKIKYKYTYN